jgi:FMN phosphatase YigB (HAD superfamily)
MIKIIFFDISNVLVKFNLKKVCFKFAKKCGKLIGEEVYYYLHDFPHWNKFKTGKITEDKFYKSIEMVSQGEIETDHLKNIIYKNFVPNQKLWKFCRGLL